MKKIPTGEYVTTKNFKLWCYLGYRNVTPGMSFGCYHNTETKLVTLYSGDFGITDIAERDFLRFFVSMDSLMTRKEKFVHELSGFFPDSEELIKRRDKLIRMKKRK